MHTLKWLSTKYLYAHLWTDNGPDSDFRHIFIVIISAFVTFTKCQRCKHKNYLLITALHTHMHMHTNKHISTTCILKRCLNVARVNWSLGRILCAVDEHRCQFSQNKVEIRCTHTHAHTDILYKCTNVEHVSWQQHRQVFLVRMRGVVIACIYVCICVCVCVCL